MADVKKPDWPQTSDGTIDWETVFENPVTGIIPALSKANNKDILHKGTVVVVKQLFTRKNDEIEVERFLRELDLILGETAGSEDLPKMRDSIVGLLRRIKDGRVEKAAAFVAAKKKEAAQSAKASRKKKKQDERRADEIKKKKKSVTLVGLGISAGALVIVAAVTMYLMFSGGDNPPSDSEDAQVEQQAPDQPAPPEPKSEPEAEQKPVVELSDSGYPLGTMTPESIKDLGPNVLILERFFWAGQVEGKSPQGTALVPVLLIEDSGVASRICDFGPNLVDAINLALSRSIVSGSKAGPDEVRKAGMVAMQMANKRLGNTWIRDLFLLYDVDKRLLVMAEKCQVAE